MTHLSGARSLTSETHLATWHGQMVTSGLYGSAYPEGVSIVDGLCHAREALEDIHTQVVSDDVTPSRLTALIAQAEAHVRTSDNILRGYVGGIYPTEVNTLLGEKHLPSDKELGSEQLKGSGVEGVFPPEEVPDSQRIPEEFYHTVNGMGVMHAEAYEVGGNHVSVPAMALAAWQLGSNNLGGKVLADAIKALEGRADADTYQQTINRLPYKTQLLRAIGKMSFEDTKQKADALLMEFVDLYGEEPHKSAEQSLSMDRAANYDTALRIAVNSYIALREHNVPSDVAIDTLYANVTSMGWTTTAVTDYFGSRPQIVEDPDTLAETLHASEHTFNSLVRTSDITVKPSQVGGLPLVRQNVMPPMPWIVPAKNVGAAARSRFENKRRTGSGCPVRYRLPMPDSGRPNNIAAFQEEIIARIGQDPGILQEVGGRSQLNPSALAVAAVVRFAEHYRCFEAIEDARQK